MSKPEPKSKVKPKAKVVPKKPDAKHKLHKLRQKSSAKKGLTDLQKEMKLKPKEIEVTAQKKEIQEFIEGVLGIKQDSHVSKFLSGIAAWLMYKMGVGGKSEPLKDEEVFGKIDQERVKLLESGIIAHRGLNESGKENDKKTIEATNKNEIGWGIFVCKKPK